LLGSPDIRSLSDLARSYEVVGGMRLVPFDKELVLRLAVLIALPLLPLLLTMIPLDELAKRLFELLV
jgi:hypothetical protein